MTVLFDLVEPLSNENPDSSTKRVFDNLKSKLWSLDWAKERNSEGDEGVLIFSYDQEAVQETGQATSTPEHRSRALQDKWDQFFLDRSDVEDLKPMYRFMDTFMTSADMDSNLIQVAGSSESSFLVIQEMELELLVPEAALYGILIQDKAHGEGTEATITEFMVTEDPYKRERSITAGSENRFVEVKILQNSFVVRDDMTFSQTMKGSPWSPIPSGDGDLSGEDLNPVDDDMALVRELMKLIR